VLFKNIMFFENIGLRIVVVTEDIQTITKSVIDVTRRYFLLGNGLP